MVRSEIIEALRRFIEEEAGLEDSSILKETTPLFESGILDSLAFLSLFPYCEQEFGLIIDVNDLNEDNFGSLESMAEFLLSKL